MIMADQTSDQIQRIARRVGRLRPDWRNPERYFEERDELEKDLRRLARQIGGHRA